MGKRPLIRRVVVRPINTGRATRRVVRRTWLTKLDFSILARTFGFRDGDECEAFAEDQQRKALERITETPDGPHGSRPAS